MSTWKTWPRPSARPATQDPAPPGRRAVRVLRRRPPGLHAGPRRGGPPDPLRDIAGSFGKPALHRRPVAPAVPALRRATRIRSSSTCSTSASICPRSSGASVPVHGPVPGPPHRPTITGIFDFYRREIPFRAKTQERPSRLRGHPFPAHRRARPQSPWALAAPGAERGHLRSLPADMARPRAASPEAWPHPSVAAMKEAVSTPRRTITFSYDIPRPHAKVMFRASPSGSTKRPDARVVHRIAKTKPEPVEGKTIVMRWTTRASGRLTRTVML